MRCSAAVLLVAMDDFGTATQGLHMEGHKLPHSSLTQCPVESALRAVWGDLRRTSKQVKLELLSQRSERSGVPIFGGLKCECKAVGYERAGLIHALQGLWPGS